MSLRTVTGIPISGLFTGQIDDGNPVPPTPPGPPPISVLPPGVAFITAGQWPVVLVADSQSGQVYHYQTAHWTKTISQLGGRVDLNIYLQFADCGTFSGQLRVKVPPELMTVSAAGFFGGPGLYTTDLQPSCLLASNPTMFAGGAQTEFRIFVYDKLHQGNQNPRPMTMDDINPQTQYIFACSYRVDSLPPPGASVALTHEIEVDDFNKEGTQHIRRRIRVPAHVYAASHRAARSGEGA